MKSHPAPALKIHLKGAVLRGPTHSWYITQSRNPLSYSWLPIAGTHRQGRQPDKPSPISRASSSRSDLSKELRTGLTWLEVQPGAHPQLPCVSRALVIMHAGHALIKAVQKALRTEAGQAGSCWNPSSAAGCKQQPFVSWELGKMPRANSSRGQSPSVPQEEGREGRGGAPETSHLRSQQSPRCNFAFSSLPPEQVTIPLSGIRT